MSFKDDDPPQAPPRRRSVEKSRQASLEAEEIMQQEKEAEQVISVKERMQKFNRMASVDIELSPGLQKDKARRQDTVSLKVIFNSVC